ncbi:hypothetical protein D3C78_1766050 [compost metagenome]
MRAVVLEHTRFHLRTGLAVFEDGPHVGHDAFVVALEQLQEQFRLAAEIRVEGPARIARLLGDVFDAGGHKALGKKDRLRGVEQTLPRLITALLSRKTDF